MNMNTTKKCKYEHQYDLSMYHSTFLFLHNINELNIFINFGLITDEVVATL